MNKKIYDLKKILFIFLVIILLFFLLVTLTGCGDNDDDYDYDSSTTGSKSSRINKKEDDDSEGLKINKKEKGSEDLKIIKAETEQIEYETYDNGLVSMEIPKGWKVDVPSVGYSSYTFKVYNPDNSDYQFLFCLKLTGFLKSEEARAMFASLYPASAFGQLAAIDPQTTEGFYKVWNDNAKITNDTQLNYEYFPYLNEFTIIENLGNLPIGGDILRATFTNNEGKLMQGIFTSSVTSSGSYYMYGYDMAPLDVYHTFMMMAPDEDFVNYQEIYDYCIGTIVFSDSFIQGFLRESATTVAIVQANAKVYDEMSDMIMDSWEKRNNSYDIISQKQSDATLGYERVYDTETGDIYKAYNGFTDDYSGSRYETITDDMYTSAISGYIEK